MKLSYIILRLKNVYMPELLDGEVEIKQFEFMFDFKREQHLCDTYILKLENFKSCSNVEEIQMINEVFVIYFSISSLKINYRIITYFNNCIVLFFPDFILIRILKFFIKN